MVHSLASDLRLSISYPEGAEAEGGHDREGAWVLREKVAVEKCITHAMLRT